MGLKTFIIDFEEMASRHYMYASCKFHYFNIQIQKSKRHLRCKVSDYFETFTGYAFKSGDYEEEGTKLLRIGDFDKYGDVDIQNMACLPQEYFNIYNKFKVEKNDIVVALTGATIGKTAIIEDSDENILLNQRVGVMRLKNENMHPKLFYLLTKLKSFQFQIQIDSMGKGQQNISPTDVSKIKIPLILKSKQDEIIAEIEPIEKKIKDLKSQITPSQKVINKIFAREFGFDEKLFNEFGKGMTVGTQIAQNRTLRNFKTNLEELSRSEILRFSTRFHNPPTKKLMDLLNNIGTLQVKDVLLERIHRGASPKYNLDGNISVVKTGHLKNGNIIISEEEFVDQDYFNSSTRSQIKKGDVLIASTGKGSLGKIDLLNEKLDLVADSHVSILRVDKKIYSSQFFIYFFRSVLGYFQIERDFTGSTNQIELYPDEISNFLIPDIPLIKQIQIVEEIRIELDKQREIKKEIKNEREEMKTLIEDAFI